MFPWYILDLLPNNPTSIHKHSQPHATAVLLIKVSTGTRKSTTLLYKWNAISDFINKSENNLFSIYQSCLASQGLTAANYNATKPFLSVGLCFKLSHQTIRTILLPHTEPSRATVLTLLLVTVDLNIYFAYSPEESLCDYSHMQLNLFISLEILLLGAIFLSE